MHHVIKSPKERLIYDQNEKIEIFVMTFAKGFHVTAMPVTIDSKEYANKMAKGMRSAPSKILNPQLLGFEALTMDLYSELLQTKKEKNQKEITDLMKMIKSLQRSNQREKDDLAASHKETILRLLKTHEKEVNQATDDLRKVRSILPLLLTQLLARNSKKRRMRWSQKQRNSRGVLYVSSQLLCTAAGIQITVAKR